MDIVTLAMSENYTDESRPCYEDTQQAIFSGNVMPPIDIPESAVGRDFVHISSHTPTKEEIMAGTFVCDTNNPNADFTEVPMTAINANIVLDRDDILCIYVDNDVLNIMVIYRTGTFYIEEFDVTFNVAKPGVYINADFIASIVNMGDPNIRYGIKWTHLKQLDNKFTRRVIDLTTLLKPYMEAQNGEEIEITNELFEEIRDASSDTIFKLKFTPSHTISVTMNDSLIDLNNYTDANKDNWFAKGCVYCGSMGSNIITGYIFLCGCRDDDICILNVRFATI